MVEPATARASCPTEMSKAGDAGKSGGRAGFAARKIVRTRPPAATRTESEPSFAFSVQSNAFPASTGPDSNRAVGIRVTSTGLVDGPPRTTSAAAATGAYRLTFNETKKRRRRRLAWKRALRRARPLLGRHPQGDRPCRGVRLRCGAGLHPEPPHLAADEPQTGELRALQGAPRRCRDRRRRLPRPLPRQPREPGRRAVSKVGRFAPEHDRGRVRDRGRCGRLPYRLAPRRAPAPRDLPRLVPPLCVRSGRLQAGGTRPARG